MADSRLGQSVATAELVCEGCGEQVEGAKLGDRVWCAWARRQAKIVLKEATDA